MGLPYWAMHDFSLQVESSRFQDEYRQYCLPVLDPHIITCTEEPFHQQLGRTNSSLVKYTTLNVVRADDGSTLGPNAEMYEIAIPTNASIEELKYRTGDQNQGVMLIRMIPEVIHNNVTVITAVNSLAPTPMAANHGGYASLLYYLMYGLWPETTGVMPADGPFHFVAKCEYPSLKYRNNYRSSWRKVDYTLRNGVSKFNYDLIKSFVKLGTYILFSILFYCAIISSFIS